MFLMCEVTHTELFIDLIRNIEREVVLIGIWRDEADTTVEVLVIVLDCEIGEQRKCYQTITIRLTTTFSCYQIIIDSDHLGFS